MTKDVNPYALMIGNPGKQIGWVCECGVRLSEELKCPGCNKVYQEKNGLLNPA